MRRATAAVIGTMAGTALLVGAKAATQREQPNPTADAGQAAGAVGAAGPVGPAGTGTPPDTAAASGTPAAGPTARATASARVTTRPSSGATRTPAPTPTRSSAPSCQSYRGGAASIASPGRGMATVTITVCGGVVTKSSGVLANYNYTSTNDKAIPVLNSLAVKYYKTNLSAIHYSGATLTSNAYQASLKSALSAAHL